MRALLDINMLLALFDEHHQHHGKVSKWFIDHIDQGWSTCPITQNGYVRIISQASYPQPVPVQAAVERLRDGTNTSYHEFWPDDISILEPERFDSTRIHSPRQLTDLYLLSLALKNGGRLVTLDQSIVTSALSGFSPESLVVL